MGSKKFLPILIGFLLTTWSAYAQSGAGSQEINYIYTGIGLGTLLAVLASWSRNHSILWAIIHSFFGWGYVIFFLITGGSRK